MVSPPVLLGIGLGAVLLLIGAYLMHLDKRLDALEQAAQDEASDADETHGPEEPSGEG